jgi:hypothetical protein
MARVRWAVVGLIAAGILMAVGGGSASAYTSREVMECPNGGDGSTWCLDLTGGEVRRAH